MDVPQIKDREHLEAWLKTRSREECVAIAYRAVMRAVPIGLYPQNSRTNRTYPRHLRRLITSGAAITLQSPELKMAADAAAGTFESADGQYAKSEINDDYAVMALVQFAAYLVAASVGEPNFLASTLNALDFVIRASKRDATALWEEVWSDLEVLAKGLDVMNRPLWQVSEAPFRDDWQDAKARIVKNGEGWDFWVRWYEAELAGRQLNRNMLAEIARLPDDVWKGDEGRLHAAIAAIARKYTNKTTNEQTVSLADSVADFLDSSPVGTKAAVSAVETAITLNFQHLPHAFDAVLGFISLEIQSLQEKNYQSDVEQEEAARQIRHLLTLVSAIRAMQSAIPVVQTIETKDAEKVEKLSRLLVRTILEWPQSNAEDVVDSSIRFTIVGGMTYLATLIGVPPGFAFAGAAFLFGGKKNAGLKGIGDS